VTDLSHDAEDGFHEIQLSGKQLVFLFMATTIVSVVIFLCGVMVGRNVRAESVNAAQRAATPPSAAGPIVQPPPPTAPEEPAPQAKTGLTYQGRLEGDKPPTETLKRAEDRDAAAMTKPAPAPATRAEAPPSPPATPPASAPAAQSARPGKWAVQVVALTDRTAAMAVVQRLSGKGYPAFLVSPQPGAAMQNYKVQVGRYDDRAEAEQIKVRLKQEEQFEPWIIR
jgi:cell division septation protein DedD